MIFELLGSPDISAQSFHTAMKAHIHCAKNRCAVFHSARDEARPEAVATELRRVKARSLDVAFDNLSPIVSSFT